MSSEQTLLEERVGTAIRCSPYVGRKVLRFEASDGRVVLRGQVASYFQKQMAQEALRGVAGVREIENQLEVIWA
jgi:osmotically-inducible protein OsmY